MPCEPIFEATVLGKHRVQYFRCRETGFIQTEDPYWLDEAYSDAITALDIGLLARNLTTRRLADMVIRNGFNREARFLDYGGGYGIFTRLMRDWGYDCWLIDPYCPNLFAKIFSLDHSITHQKRQRSHDTKFELLTAWELFEHIVDPKSELEKMLELSDSILFSTQLVPEPVPENAEDWWYFIPETGQHVSFYTEAALKDLATKHDAKLYSDGKSFHLITRRANLCNPFGGRFRQAFSQIQASISRKFGKRRSLLPKDLELMREQLSKRLRTES